MKINFQFEMTRYITQSVMVFFILTLLGWGNLVYSQDLGGLGAEPTQVDRVIIGAHPLYTRILINLDHEVVYNVKADFLEKRVTFSLKNAVLGSRARSRIFKDRNLLKVNLAQESDQTVSVSLFLKNKNRVRRN